MMSATLLRLVKQCGAALLGACILVSGVHAEDKVFEDKLGAGDTIRVQVFQNPDLR